MACMGPKPGTVYKLPPHDIITEGGAVGVLLSNRPERVWVDQADYSRIVSAHGNRVWAWIEDSRYVKLTVDRKSSVSVARLVVGEAGRFIRYADGDRLNLRRENLTTEEPVQPGPRKKPDASPKPSALKSAQPRTLEARRTVRQARPPPIVQAPARSLLVPASPQVVKRPPPVIGTVKRQQASTP